VFLFGGRRAQIFDLMLNIVLGANGSGKSLFAMHKLIEVLTTTEKFVVTTLAVHLDLLNEYMQKIGKAADVSNRILVIGKEEMKRFWRYRGKEADNEYGWNPVVLGPFGDKSWQNARFGVVYILDECQVGFGARQWTSTGPEYVEYQSQHRKYSDDVWAISPAASLLDKQFRTLSHFTTVLTNQYKIKIGWFVPPKKIKFEVYQNCPPERHEERLQGGDFQIDAKGLASCYNTAGGLGFTGANADKGDRAKGIPAWTIIPGTILLGLLIYFTLSRSTKLAVGWGTKKIQLGEVANMQQGAQSAAVPVLMPAAVFPNNFQRVQEMGAPVVKHEEKRTKYYGVIRTGNNFAGIKTYLDTEVGLVEGKDFHEEGILGYLDNAIFERAKKGTNGLVVK